MKRRISWLVLSCLILAGLLLASCAPAPSPNPTPTPTATAEPKPTVTPSPGAEMVKDSLGRLVEKPKYGGTLTILSPGSDAGRPVLGFDPGLTRAYNCRTMMLTNEKLGAGNWKMGPTGTNEYPFASRGGYYPPVMINNLAESWEIPDANTVVFHIRQGVHFGLNPKSEASRLVNGREVTAADVAYSITRESTMPLANAMQMVPGWLKSATATDKWTVVVKGDDTEAHRTGLAFELLNDMTYIIPPEVVQKYGDLVKWENSVGTGPFMLTDYISSSISTLVKNPNYWRKHPLYPDDTMPYVDVVKLLVMPDTSTQIAALRTHKIDSLVDITWENSEGILKTNPELRERKVLYTSGDALWMNTQVKPFNDIRVRRAIAMAIDRKAIKESFYGGPAEWYNYPVIPDFKDSYVAVEDMPASIKELWTYNPEGAKKLLVEAGYPNGFKTSALSEAGGVDLLSVIKADLAKVGVDVALDVREATVFKTMSYGAAYDMILQGPSTGKPYLITNLVPGTTSNWPRVSDPYINERQSDIYKFENVNNLAKRAQLMREMMLRIFDQAYNAQLPVPYTRIMWQPWLKGFNGEYSVGYYNLAPEAIYGWLDRDLKQQMTGTR